MTYQCLEVSERGAALWITLNRPESLNALNRQIVEELNQAFAELYQRQDVRVVVLRGAGRAFCAGYDLKEHSEAGARRRCPRASSHSAAIETSSSPCAAARSRS
jgi:enoyl-CoA hydratase/carnithine racemase